MKKLLFAVSLSMTIVAGEKNLLLFLDQELQEQVGQEFNVSYQFVVALMQKPGEIIVTQSLLQNIIRRKQMFQERFVDQGTVEFEFFNMFSSVQKGVAKKSIRYLNKQMDFSWVSQNFPQIARLSQEKYKQLAFNFLCYQVCQKLESWSFVRQKNGFILCGLEQQSKKLSQDEIVSLDPAAQGSIIPALQSVVTNKKDSWVVYLSGHGHSKSESDKDALVSGMRVGEFKAFLRFLDNNMSTTLLVYNSCFAGGRDGLSVYKNKGKDLLLSYDVIMTSIAGAPTYVFGTPSGFKLPPYSSGNQLESSDIRNGAFQPFFFQYFPEFFTYAHQQFCDDKCMFLINHYKGCLEQGCPVYQIENLPMVRHANRNKFVPLDDRDHFVVDNIRGNKIVLEDQKVALWYQSEYKGTVYCIGSPPHFISMNHEKINRHRIGEIIIAQNIQTFLAEAFVHLEDRDTETAWTIDTIIVQTRRGQKKYHNVQVMQNKDGTSWII